MGVGEATQEEKVKLEECANIYFLYTQVSGIMEIVVLPGLGRWGNKKVKINMDEKINIDNKLL